MNKLVKKVISILEINTIINYENKEIIYYGMELLFYKIIYYAIILFIGLITDRVYHMALYMLFFEPLRIYAGGFHAKSQKNCFIISFLMLVTVAFAIRLKLSVWYILLFVRIALIFGIVIWFIAPVETKNRLLDIVEIKIYRKRTRCILFAESVVVIFCIMVKLYDLPYIISLCWICTGFLLLTGYYHNKFSRMDKKLV